MSIKLGEIKGLVKEEFNEVEFEGLSEKIKIKNYLSINEKITIIEIIVASSFIEDEETKIKKLNPVIKELLTDYYIVKSYSNLLDDELEEDKTVIYDMLKQGGLIEYIYTMINSDEIDYVLDNIENRIEEEQKFIDRKIENDKNIAVVVGKIFDRLKEFGVDIMGLLDGIDENKLELIKNYITSMSSNINENGMAGLNIKGMINDVKDIVKGS